MAQDKLASKLEMYLGDGVYAESDGYEVVVYLNDGLGRKSVIVLEPQVLTALLKFCDLYGPFRTLPEVDSDGP